MFDVLSLIFKGGFTASVDIFGSTVISWNMTCTHFIFIYVQSKISPFPDPHIYQGLSQLSPDAAEEAKRHRDLEEEAVNHDEMADTQVTPENVPGSHHHDTGQGRAEKVTAVRRCYVMMLRIHLKIKF